MHTCAHTQPTGKRPEPREEKERCIRCIILRLRENAALVAHPPPPTSRPPPSSPPPAPPPSPCSCTSLFPSLLPSTSPPLAPATLPTWEAARGRLRNALGRRRRRREPLRKLRYKEGYLRWEGGGARGRLRAASRSNRRAASSSSWANCCDRGKAAEAVRAVIGGLGSVSRVGGRSGGRNEKERGREEERRRGGEKESNGEEMTGMKKRGGGARGAEHDIGEQTGVCLCVCV